LSLQDRQRKQPTLAATFSRSAPYDPANPKVDRLNALLVQLICKEGLPLALVDSPAFKEFVRELDPRYVLPTRQAMSQKLVPELYENTKAQLKTTLTQSRSQSLTRDTWTASNNQSYMGVTVHWLNEAFDMQSKCLTVRHVPGSHTADFMAAELTSVCQEWELDLQGLHVITDSAANIRKAITQLKVEKWRPCFAHSLQLCVNTSLNSREVSDLPKVLAKARTIVGHFRRSPLASNQLEKAQQQLNLPRHKLLQDCATRWNSQVGLTTVIYSATGMF